MNYFTNITGLSELKKQFRTLVLKNHPDRGGSTEAMQEINAQFENLYNIWKDRPEATATGYENDYTGASAREYSEHVYNEYKWTGSRYEGQNPDEIAVIIRKFLKETYPNYKFSVTQKHYGSIRIAIMSADFNIFTDGKNHGDVSQYCIDDNESLTPRAKEVFSNIRDYAMSYNFDDSDAMTDYFHTNFYLTLSVGTWSKPYTVEIPKSHRTGGHAPKEFKAPEGAAHKAIRRALGKAFFSTEDNTAGRLVLSENYFSGEKKTKKFTYSSATQAQKRADKLAAAGIITKITNHLTIEFVGYTPEVEHLLTEEDREAERLRAEWEAEQRGEKTATEQPTNETTADSALKSPQATEANKGFEVVDYSDKAVALFGNTRLIKDKLKEIGGRFNPGLQDGNARRAGWIFSKKKADELQQLISSL